MTGKMQFHKCQEIKTNKTEHILPFSEYNKLINFPPTRSVT